MNEGVDPYLNSGKPFVKKPGTSGHYISTRGPGQGEKLVQNQKRLDGTLLSTIRIKWRLRGEEKTGVRVRMDGGAS